MNLPDAGARWAVVCKAAIGAFMFAAAALVCTPGWAQSDIKTAVAAAYADVSPGVASELDAANAAFSAAWVAGDVEALLNAYTRDAIVHSPAGGVLTTREQIRDVWAPILNWHRVGHRLEPTLRRAMGNGAVLEMGRWHSSRTVEGRYPWLSGCYTVLWRREAGVWRMAYDSWSAANDASWACRPR